MNPQKLGYSVAISALLLCRGVAAITNVNADENISEQENKASVDASNIDARLQYQSLKQSCPSMEETFEEYARNGSVYKCASKKSEQPDHLFEYDMGPRAFHSVEDPYVWSEASSASEAKDTFWINEEWQICRIEFTPEKARNGTYTLTPTFYPGTRKLKGYDYVLHSGNGGKGLSHRSGIKLKNFTLYAVPIAKDSDYLRKHGCVLEPVILTNTRPPAPPPPRVAQDPVRIEVDVRGTSLVTGNGSVFIKNYSNVSQSVTYRRTVNFHGGASQEFAIKLAPNERREIGSTCAYNVSYTGSCGSSVSYQIIR